MQSDASQKQAKESLSGKSQVFDKQAEQSLSKKDQISDQQPKKESSVFFLSADDSNSAASPVIAKKLILQGKYVHPDIIRTYEFLNYFSFNYTAPADGDIAIIPQMRKLDKTGKYSLQVAIRSKNRAFKDMRPMVITFLLDASGSMAGEPEKLAKTFIMKFAKKLRINDIISIVSFNREPEILLDSHKVNADTPKLLQGLLDSVKINNVTDFEKGITAAYQLAGKNYNGKCLNRVVLISDGAANAGSLSLATIGKHAEDSDKQGIYLAGVGLGNGFNDSLMNAVTDKGRGAYLFIDSTDDVDQALGEGFFGANFDLIVKDVRLKMVLPAGWKKEEFHGEQISEKAEDIIPQYLAPNDQMIYHLTVATDKKGPQAEQSVFEFEAEYTPLQGQAMKRTIKKKVSSMIVKQKEILKGDAIVAYAEMLKKIQFPLLSHRDENLKEFSSAYNKIVHINGVLKDKEISGIIQLMDAYKQVIQYGEKFPGARDGQEDSPDAVLGIKSSCVIKVESKGPNIKQAIRPLERLLHSTHLVPLEGYKFLALSSGPVGNPQPSGSGQLSNLLFKDPIPAFMGLKKTDPLELQRNVRIHDLHQMVFVMKAPKEAKSFSFDFNFFSAEYPQYVKSNFNDTFYAILEAESTNGGAPTSISFDANNNSIEVDNNYFQKEFHPIPNTGTGFDNHGSTGWLRTSWPIKGGEEFTLTFSIHDEGDAVFDSLVVIDNFQWHSYDAVGTTDPLN